ncbi:MAG: histidine kinase [Bacteroidales bacterium]|nr:histidine kinase [Bacteroidales bacterium]
MKRMRDVGWCTRKQKRGWCVIMLQRNHQGTSLQKKIDHPCPWLVHPLFSVITGKRIISLIIRGISLISCPDITTIAYFCRMTTIRYIRFLAPVLFWLFQVIVFLIRNIYQFSQGAASNVLRTMYMTFPLDCLTFCLFYFYFAPRFYNKQKWRWNLLLVVLFFAFNSGLWAGLYYLHGISQEQDIFFYYLSSMGHNLLYAFYGILFRIGIDWFEKRDRRRELEKQQVKTELALLQSQINPHFLFNILNNIHSFALRDPEKTSFAIIRLAEIMRYMLYEASAEQVPVRREINYISSYLDLQKLRYKDPGFVLFDIRGEPDGILIPPLLFIPFIENSFKHGRKSVDDKIRISITLNAGKIDFYCRNAKRELSDQELTMKKGIGLINIKRRLELLFPGCHSLQIRDNNQEYSVELTIQLHENQVHSH